MSNKTVIDRKKTDEIIRSQGAALEQLSKELAIARKEKEFWTSQYLSLSATIKQCCEEEAMPKTVTVQIDPKKIADTVSGGQSDV